MNRTRLLSPTWRPGREGVLVALACVAFLCHAALYWNWVEDDAWISLRYAANLVAGNGLVFNPGQRVEGYSNLPWVLVEAVALKVGVDGLDTARTLGLLAGVGCLLVSWRLARRLAARPSLATVVAPWFLALDPILPRHAVTGLETTAHALAVGLAVLVACGDSRRRAALALPWLLALVAVSRPEGGLLALLVAVGAHRRHRLSWRAWMAPLILLAATAVARAWYFGAWLPNTFHFKMTGTTAGLPLGLHYCLDFLRENGGGVLVGFGLLPLLRPATQSRTITILLLCAAQAGVAIAAGGDWMSHYRYFAPVLPLAAALFAAGLVPAWSRVGESAPSRQLALVAAAAVAVMFMNIAKVERQVWRLVMPSVRAGGYTSQVYGDVGRWLKVNTPPDAIVAASDVGAIAFHSDRHILDMLGLLDAHIARTPGMLHGKHDVPYVLAHDPEVVILVAGHDADCRPVYNRQADAAMAVDPGFRERYRLAASFNIAFQQETAQVYRRR